MKGFILTHNNHQISGGIEKGTTGVTISLKNQICEVSFNSLDSDGMQAYVWHSSEVAPGDELSVQFVEMTDVPVPPEKIDYSDTVMLAKLELETYHRLKAELNSEGLL